MAMLYQFKSFLGEKYSTFNLFDTRSTDREIVHRQILSTRLFLILFISSICILLAYTCLDVQTKSVTVLQPTQTTYDILLTRYADTLECPCTRVSTHYGSFVQATPVFHQVCSSDFVSQAWLDFSFDANATFVWPMDVRTSISAVWQMITALCQSSNRTLADALVEFASTPLVSSVVLSEVQVRAKTQAALDLVFQTASETLVRSITIAHRIMQANAYTTGLLINSIVMTPSGSWSVLSSIYPKETIYYLRGSNEPCYCLRDRSCPMPGGLYFYDAWDAFGFYDLNTIDPNQILSGIVIDCLPTQTTFASSLECFYNQSCANILLSAYTRSVNMSILDASSPSNFAPTTPVEELINRLFLEYVLNTTDYRSYYLECAPTSCSYTYSHRFDWAYVITSLVALFGGLNVVMRLITPYLVGLLLVLKGKLREEIQPRENQGTVSYSQ